MAIKIRPNEPTCNITLTKEKWLGVLTFLTQYHEQAATDKIDEVLKEALPIVRGFIFRKGGSGDLCLELNKEQALELFLHCKDFQSKLSDDQKDGVESIIETIKKFLIEEQNEQS